MFKLIKKKTKSLFIIKKQIILSIIIQNVSEKNYVARIRSVLINV